MPQSGITWRQSRIEPSRVAPRRLTGLRTTVARFRLLASAGMPTARPPTAPGPRPAVAVRELGREAPDADSPTGCPQPGAAVPVRASAASGDNPDGVSRNCLPAGPWSCGKTCAPTHRARFDCEDPWPGRRRVSTRVVAVHSHTGSRAAEFIRTPYTVLAYGPSQIRTRHYECKVARGGRRGRRRGFGDRT